MIEDPIQVLILDDDSGNYIPCAIPRSKVHHMRAMALVDGILASAELEGEGISSLLSEDGRQEFRNMLVWRAVDELRKLPS